MILMKLGWFQVFRHICQSTNQNSISNFFENIMKFFGLPWCRTREDISIDVSITNVGLILTKIGWFLSRGTDRQTNTILEFSYGNMSAHTKFKLKAQNQELAVDRFMHLRMTGMHNWNCQITKVKCYDLYWIKALHVKYIFYALK